MSEIVIERLVIPLPSTEFVLGALAGYYLIGFGFLLINFRKSDDDPLSTDILLAAVGGVIWGVEIPEIAKELVEHEETEDNSVNTGDTDE
jgi:hypothetical protein